MDHDEKEEQAKLILTQLQALLNESQQNVNELDERRKLIAEQLVQLENQSVAMYSAINSLDSLRNQTESAATELAARQSSIDTKISEIENGLNNLKVEQTNIKQIIDAELPQFRQRVESEQTTMRQNTESEQATFRQTIEAEQSVLRLKLEELSISFQTKHNEQQAERSKEFTDKIAELQQLTNTRIAEEIKAAEVIMAVLDKYEGQAQQVLGTVINTSQAGIYKLDAIEEGKAKKFFRAWASSFMIFAVIILVGPAVYEIFMNGVPNVTIDWHEWLKRLPISIVLLLPAFYFARESTRHSNNERKSKRQEQVLSTINPYLELLDEKDRGPLKAKLAEVIFNPNETPSQPSENEISGFLAPLLVALRTAINKQ